MEDCKKCSQTTENCECNISDEEKHKGLYQFCKSLRAEKKIYSKEEVIKDPPYTGYDYRQEMRDFVIDISQYGKALQPNFIIIHFKVLFLWYYYITIYI